MVSQMVTKSFPSNHSRPFGEAEAAILLYPLLLSSEPIRHSFRIKPDTRADPERRD